MRYINTVNNTELSTEMCSTNSSSVGGIVLSYFWGMGEWCRANMVVERSWCRVWREVRFLACVFSFLKSEGHWRRYKMLFSFVPTQHPQYFFSDSQAPPPFVVQFLPHSCIIVLLILSSTWTICRWTMWTF